MATHTRIETSIEDDTRPGTFNGLLEAAFFAGAAWNEQQHSADAFADPEPDFAAWRRSLVAHE